MMKSTVELVCDNNELNARYLKAKDELETSLKLYRLVVVHDVNSEIPVMYKRVKKSQAIYEMLFKQVHPFGEL
ncbi:hypothetical protein ACB087_10115 (plasmid) [Vibrio sp. VNB-15]